LKYIDFTESQIEQANNTDLSEFLKSQGEQLKKSGKDWRWLRHKEITVCGNRWYHQYERRGGYAISFIKEFFNLSFPDAVNMLLGINKISPSLSEKKLKPAENIDFVLPKANSNMRRVYAYLMKKRMIDRDIITCFAKARMIYEDAKYHNAVFVGMNGNGVPKYAQKRGTFSNQSNFRGNAAGSDLRYSFSSTGTGPELFVFEAPIDMLSYITLNKDDWQKNSYLALCGVTDIPLLNFLSQNKNICTVCLCLDNDTAGLVASKRIAEKLRQQTYTVNFDISQEKDWNEQLCISAEDQIIKFC
jgi:hypothetical protein